MNLLNLLFSSLPMLFLAACTPAEEIFAVEEVAKVAEDIEKNLEEKNKK